MELHTQVLYIAPDNTFRRVAANFLRANKCVVVETSSFTEVVGWSKMGEFDVVLLDESACFDDANDIDDSLRRLSSDTPIFMVHSNLSKNLLVRFMLLGVYGFINKPFNFDRLLACITEGVCSTAFVNQRKLGRKSTSKRFFGGFGMAQPYLH